MNESRPASPAEIILASASPRRKELLTALGIPFSIKTAQVEELDGDSAPQLSPVDLACENARLKAEAVAAASPGRWVLGADTVVALGGLLLGKPSSLDQARDFLLALSGRTHEVITGCVLIAPNAEVESFHELSRVTFFPLSLEVIARYLAQVHVLDKAGAYAIQERGEWIIDRVEGSCTNVIGLPMERLEIQLRKRKLL